MKFAIILAHPRSGSLCASIARTCVAALRDLGHAVVFSDLYAMGFDPRLRDEEIPASKGFAAGADVIAERSRLAEADGFIFVYPFWFNAPPAILKGYVDRVFGMGFGYGPTRGHGNQSLLAGRRLLSFSTSGAPDHWVNSTGALKALMQVFDAHLAAVCGLTLVDHVHFGGILSTLTREAAESLLEDVRVTLAREFPAQAS